MNILIEVKLLCVVCAFLFFFSLVSVDLYVAEVVSNLSPKSRDLAEFLLLFFFVAFLFFLQVVILGND